VKKKRLYAGQFALVVILYKYAVFGGNKMKITFRKFSRRLPEYNKIKQLYKTAFPAEERAPFLLLEYKAARNKGDFRGVYSDGRLIGMVYTVGSGDLHYLFYLAVCEQERGKGVGSAIISALKKKYSGGRLFLALEELDAASENYSQRLSRRKFYEKNGLSGLDFKIREGNMVYDAMGLGGKIMPEEYDRLMKKYLGKPLSLLAPTYAITTEKGEEK